MADNRKLNYCRIEEEVESKCGEFSFIHSRCHVLSLSLSSDCKGEVNKSTANL